MHDQHRAANAAAPVTTVLGRLFWDARGTSVVQYAILLGFIACAGILLFDSAEFAARQFNGVFSEEMPAVAARSTSTQTGGFDSAGGPTEPAGTTAGSAWLVTAAAVCLVALTAAVGGWHLVRRRFHRKVRETLDKPEDRTRLTPRQKRCLFAKRQQILRVLSHDKTTLLKSRIQVRHLMSHDVLTIKPNTPVTEVLDLMKDSEVRHLLVCDGDGKVLGIISDRDIRDRHGKRAVDIMTPDPQSVSPEVPVGRVITLMMNKHISCVPVVEDGELRGILTSTDMMMTLHSTLQILMKLASKPGPAADPESVSVG